jgi:L-seryl-tRNA(Ser) seleniumtransferase
VNSASAGLSKLPSVDRVLGFAAVQPLIEEHGRSPVTEAVRKLLVDLRSRANGARVSGSDLSETSLSAQLVERLSAQARPNLRPVFNLTGTVLHTNLGRALLPK